MEKENLRGVFIQGLLNAFVAVGTWECINHFLLDPPESPDVTSTVEVDRDRALSLNCHITPNGLDCRLEVENSSTLVETAQEMHFTQIIECLGVLEIEVDRQAY